MASDSANARNLRSGSLANPADAARAKMDDAFAELEAALRQKLAEAGRLVQEAQQAASATDHAGEVTQWRNATRLLEEQLTALREENSLLHSEIHKLRQDTLALSQENASRKAAVQDALKAVEEATHGIQSLLGE